MLPRLSLHMAFPPCRAPEALALRALHPIVRTSYRISFLLRREWSQSSHLVKRGRLVGTIPQAEFLVHYRGALHARVHSLLVLPGVRALTSRLSTTRRTLEYAILHSPP